MGYTNPLFILIVHTPGLVGVAMVWRHYGLQGLRRFFHRFRQWRMSAGWWALLVLGLSAPYFAGAAIVGNNLNPFRTWDAPCGTATAERSCPGVEGARLIGGDRDHPGPWGRSQHLGAEGP